jgi:uncharacterized protein (TIGR02145 family)
MGDLIFNGITPGSGKIKLGSQNVNKIYAGTTQVWPQGTPPGENEVLIGSLVWKTYNELLPSEGISQATNSSEAITYLDNNTPAYVYYQFNSSNSSRGILVNRQGAEALIPPPGFRLPTHDDFSNLNTALELESSGANPNDVTLVGGGDPNYWPSTITSNVEFGTSGFDSKGSGYGYKVNTVLAFESNSEQYWTSDLVSNEEDYTVGFSYVDEPFLTPDYLSYAVQANINKYAYVRFCRDY